MSRFDDRGRPGTKTGGKTTLTQPGIQPLPSKEVRASHDHSVIDWRRAFRANGAIGLEKYRLAERVLVRGQRVFSQGETADYVYLLLSGWVALDQVLPDGQRQILDFALPGSLIGHQQDGKGSAPHSGECLTDCWLVVFQRRRFMDFVEASDVAFKLYESTLLQDLTRAQHNLANVARRNGAEKIASLIVQLMERAESTCIDEEPRRLPITQNHLAAALGITNVYVSRMVKSLREQNLIAWRKGCLHVLDPEGVRALATG